MTRCSTGWWEKLIISLYERLMIMNDCEIGKKSLLISILCFLSHEAFRVLIHLDNQDPLSWCALWNITHALLYKNLVKFFINYCALHSHGKSWWEENDWFATHRFCSVASVWWNCFGPGPRNWTLPVLLELTLRNRLTLIRVSFWKCPFLMRKIAETRFRAHSFNMVTLGSPIGNQSISLKRPWQNTKWS